MKSQIALGQENSAPLTGSRAIARAFTSKGKNAIAQERMAVELIS